MKIEMGESLIYSYLRHVKSCLITQTNWKTSGNWGYQSSAGELVNSEFERIKSHPSFQDIFPSNLEQTLKQAEIDVIGIDNDLTIYAVDIAYHENGLQYGGKNETKERVVKKLLRTYLILNLYYPEYQHNIIFCSPKVNPATDKVISEFMKILEQDFSNATNQFLYIANDDFNEQIIQPTLNSFSSESDSSELFARSFKLIDMFASKEKKSNIHEPTKERNILVKKSDAINCINEQLKKSVSNSNVIFSSINSMRDIWWFEPQNERFKSDMYLALYDNKSKLLNVFLIPANTIQDINTTFYQRADKADKSSIIIPTNDESFTD